MKEGISQSTSAFWLKSPTAWLAYIFAWLAFSSGFTTIFLLTSRPSLATAICASLQIVLPAAVLGIGVIWSCRYMPLPTNKSLRFLGAHILLAIIYPSLWIITVVVIASIIALAQQGHWIFSLPPDHITHWHFFAGSMIYFALASVTYTIDGVARSEARRRQAEIWMLRARLNPHFLFNTLHSLLALVRYDPDAADSALEQFAGMFRYALRVNQNSLEEVTLLEEWNFTRDYLALERLRLGERLRLETNISEQALTCLIPAFLLQPLVENAIRYAVAPRAEGGTIWVYASCEAHYLTVTVKDDGPGTTSPEALTSSGVGLQVAREQLAAYYGGSAKIEIAKDLSKGFAVTASIPIRE